MNRGKIIIIKLVIIQRVFPCIIIQNFNLRMDKTCLEIQKQFFYELLGFHDKYKVYFQMQASEIIFGENVLIHLRFNQKKHVTTI